MIATIAGLLAGGTATVFALPYIVGGLSKVYPKTEGSGFGAFEILAGGGAFIVGVTVAALTAGLVHSVVGGKPAMTAKV